MPTGELSLIFMLLGPYGVVPVALQLGALGCVARAHGAVVVATATSKSVLISELISELISLLMSELLSVLISELISGLISVLMPVLISVLISVFCNVSYFLSYFVLIQQGLPAVHPDVALTSS